MRVYDLNGSGLSTKEIVGPPEMVTVSEYSTAYGLEPGPKGVDVCLVFGRSSRDNTRHRINTVQAVNTHHRYNTSTFFLIFPFLCTKYMKK